MEADQAMKMQWHHERQKKPQEKSWVVVMVSGGGGGGGGHWSLDSMASNLLLIYLLKGVYRQQDAIKHCSNKWKSKWHVMLCHLIPPD